MENSSELRQNTKKRGTSKREKKSSIDGRKLQGKETKFGLGARIVGIFSVIIILSLIIVGTVVNIKASNVIEQNYQDSNMELLEEVNAEIVNYLGKFDTIARFLSEDKAIKFINSSVTFEDTVNQMFTNLVTNNSEISSVYYGTEKGAFHLKPDFDLPADYDPRVRPWYTDAMDAKALIWTDPYIDVSTNELIISAAVPVESNYSGKYLGVVGLDILLTTMADSVNSIQVGESGHIMILTKDNTYMTHKDASKIGEPLEFAEFENAINTSDSGHVMFNEEVDGRNVEKMATFMKVEDLGWTIVAVIDMDEIRSDAAGISSTILLVGMIALAVGFVLALLFSKTITNNINKLLKNMESIREGDFTTKVEINSSDEIGVMGQYFNETIGTIGGFLKKIQIASDELMSSSEMLAATSEETTASADEVANTVEEIAKGASDQASDAERSVMVAKELSDKFDELNENTHSMLTSAGEVMNANKEGYKAVNGLKEKTDLSADANNKIETAIAELNEKTQYIGGILDTISAISVQTNLLALNASIEAARAGEHGRGFAVVAEEIRKLAEESSNAADEVREIVVNIQTDSTRTVESMSEVKEISQEQSHAVTEVTSSFDTISRAIEGISAQIDQMGSFIQLLNEDKDSIVDSIENISAVSEETAAASEEVTATMIQQVEAVEEVSKSAERLNEIAQEVNAELKRFKVE